MRGHSERDVPLVNLHELVCGTCGVPHAIPEALYVKCKEEGGFWHCPNGHTRGWGEGTTTAKLKRAEQALAQKDDEIRAAHDALVYAKSQIEKQKKRAAHGVCPCCNRTFVQLARHMKTKHPDYNVVPLKAS